MLKITTPCFVEGGWIPDDNAGFGEDKSPGYNHWIAWNITPTILLIVD